MQHDDATKAAVLAELQLATPIKTLARKYGITANTIRRWRSDAGLTEPGVTPEKKEELGAAVLDYIYATLKTLKIQAEFFGDPAWLREQGAASIYLLHGVLADKAIRLLAAIQEGDGPDRE